ICIFDLVISCLPLVWKYHNEDVDVPPPSVSVRPSGEIKEGTSVTLTCSSEANPAATFVWYKTNGRTPLSKEPQLVFRSIEPSDSGQYYFYVHSCLVTSRTDYCNSLLHGLPLNTETLEIINVLHG
uniref:Ig-like domain-containing protein n=1 Tax=Maylandia zebra TaxID=106582 RepID=A0A3P9CBS2_9CICH